MISMKLNLFRFFKIFAPHHPCRDAWKSFRRHKTLTLATVALIALMVFIFNVVFSIHTLTNEVFVFLNEKVDVSMEFTDNASIADIAILISELNKQDFVKEARFVSRDDALDTVDKELIPGYKAFVERYGLQNPFPSSLNIITPSVEDHARVFEFIKQSSYRDLFPSSLFIETDEEMTTEQMMLTKTAADELRGFAELINSTLFFVLFLFGAASIAILVNAIYLSLKAKKHEISIMHIVGASEKYIALPYTYEGMLYGIFSSVIGLAAFYATVLLGGSELVSILFSYQQILLQIVFVTLFSGIISFAMVHMTLRGKMEL